MHKSLQAITLAGVMVVLLGAASKISSSLIPDGTYTVQVTAATSSSIDVTMANGTESTTLTAGRDTIKFDKVKPGDTLKLSLIKGKVMVYIDLTSH